jgi:hypothetical protein
MNGVVPEKKRDFEKRKVIKMTEFDRGMEVEKEHKDLIGNDKKKRAMIVNAHLKENPKYYTLLEKLEGRKEK